MKYNSADASNLLTDGDAYFLISDIKDTVVKGTNKPQFIITFKVVDINKKHGVMTEYFPIDLLWKLKKLCEATGQMDLFNSDNIEPEQLMNKKGIFNIKVQSSAGYDDKMVVSKWIKYDADKMQIESPFHDDAIPF